MQRAVGPEDPLLDLVVGSALDRAFERGIGGGAVIGVDRLEEALVGYVDVRRQTVERLAPLRPGDHARHDVPAPVPQPARVHRQVQIRLHPAELGLRPGSLRLAPERGHPVGDVASQLGEDGDLFGVEGVGLGRIDLEHSERPRLPQQRQRDDRMKAVLPRRHLAPGAVVWRTLETPHNAEMAGPDGCRGRPRATGPLGPAQVRGGEEALVRPGNRRGTKGPRRVVLDEADPRHRIAADIHRDPADVSQQGAFLGGADEGLVGVTQHPERAVGPDLRRLGLLLLGDVDVAADHVSRPSLGIPHDVGLGQDPAPAPVLVAHAELDPVVGPGIGEIIRQQPGDAGKILGVNPGFELSEAVADLLR